MTANVHRDTVDPRRLALVTDRVELLADNAVHLGVVGRIRGSKRAHEARLVGRTLFEHPRYALVLDELHRVHLVREALIDAAERQDTERVVTLATALVDDHIPALDALIRRNDG